MNRDLGLPDDGLFAEQRMPLPSALTLEIKVDTAEPSAPILFGRLHNRLKQTCSVRVRASVEPLCAGGTVCLLDAEVELPGRSEKVESFSLPESTTVAGTHRVRAELRDPASNEVVCETTVEFSIP